MAVGDSVSDIQSIAAGAYLDLQPGAGVEWLIQNIYYQNAITIEQYDGTNVLVFATETGPNVFSRVAFRCNNTDRIRVKNAHGATAYLIGYDGVITK